MGSTRRQPAMLNFVSICQILHLHPWTKPSRTPSAGSWTILTRPESSCLFCYKSRRFVTAVNAARRSFSYIPYTQLKIVKSSLQSIFLSPLPLLAVRPADAINNKQICSMFKSRTCRVHDRCCFLRLVNHGLCPAGRCAISSFFSKSSLCNS